MKNIEYLFPKYERSRFELAVGMILMPIIILGAFGICIITSYKMNPYYKTILLAWGVVFALFLIVPLLYGLKDRKYRLARYAFQDHSVMIQIGRTKREINSADAIHAFRKVMLIGEKGAELQQSFWMLWKEGSEVPSDTMNPYRALKESQILLLPYNEEVFERLRILFGEKDDLQQDLIWDNNTYYVFSDEEREKNKAVTSIWPSIHVGFWAMYFILGISSFIFAFGMLYVPILVFSIFWICNRTVRLARYRFSEDTVTMRFGKTERMINASDSFLISYREMFFNMGHSKYEEKYIVLWKNDEPVPKDHISPYYMMKHANVIILPNTEFVRIQLQRTLGITEIGYLAPLIK